MSFEQGALHFHFALGLTNYAAGPGWGHGALKPKGAVLTYTIVPSLA